MSSQILQIKHLVDDSVRRDGPLPDKFNFSLRVEIMSVYLALRDEKFRDLLQEIGSLKLMSDADSWLIEFYDWADAKGIEVQ